MGFPVALCLDLYFMNRKELIGELALLLTALVWGFGFAAQSLGMDHLGEFTLVGTRSLLAALALEPIILFGDKRRGSKPLPAERQKLIKGGLIIGLFLFTASAAQQFAISYVDSNGIPEPIGKVSFLTAMYMVLVPVFAIFFGRKTGFKTWISVLTGCAGMYLLCGLYEGSFSFGGGDLFAILCAALYSFQIIMIDIFAPDVDSVRLSQMQFIVCGVLSMICAFITEDVTLSGIWAGKWAIIYLGLISSGVGYTLQIVGQKHVRPQISSLIMCLESVFGAFAGYILLGERMGAAEIAGAALMLAAVVISQIEIKKMKA